MDCLKRHRLPLFNGVKDTVKDTQFADPFVFLILKLDHHHARIYCYARRGAAGGRRACSKHTQCRHLYINKPFANNRTSLYHPDVCSW